ncbi:MAG: nitroreductase [Proteobacteria bacterium]|jgi:nitroreductase|nr:nitroreductase [Pseudomonadota bacterium]
MEIEDTTTQIEALNKVLDKRYSCRDFKTKPVPEALIKSIVNTAQKVPSWCNAQPWQVDVITGGKLTELREKTTKAGANGMHQPDIPFPSKYDGVYKMRRRECALQLYGSVGIKMGDRESSQRQMLRNYEFFGASSVAVITSAKELGTYGILDCGSFITAFTLAATASGLASIPQAALAGQAPVIRDFLKIPHDRDIVCVISFGYANSKSPINTFKTSREEFYKVCKFHSDLT